MRGRKMAECALTKCEGLPWREMEHGEHLDWGLPLCLSNAVAHFFFSDQRHMKHVCIFYKLETQGITLQLEDQKAGEGRLHGRRS